MNYRRIFIENSIIFVTMVTQHRASLLIDKFDLLIASINEVKQYYNFEIIAYIILNDHCHFLLQVEDIKKYPKIIHSIKYNFKKNVGVATPTYHKIWQNRYWEHTIRDENDLYHHIDYIHYNPIKHGYVKKVNDYRYSSFAKFVQEGYYDEEWCNFDDKHNVINCNYE
ncbi:transposase [bacterium]|nr:transposase [bacterium]